MIDPVPSGREWDFRADRIGSALRGANPTVLARLPLAFAVIGDVQFLPGYCVLIVDRPGVDRLSDLPRTLRHAFLGSLDVLAEAVERACVSLDSSFLRVNLEILGNTDPFLHAHVWPRYGWEPPDRVGEPVWRYPTQRWSDADSRLGAQHDPIRRAVIGELRRLGADPEAETSPSA